MGVLFPFIANFLYLTTRLFLCQYRPGFQNLMIAAGCAMMIHIRTEIALF